MPHAKRSPIVFIVRSMPIFCVEETLLYRRESKNLYAFLGRGFFSSPQQQTFRSGRAVKIVSLGTFPQHVEHFDIASTDDLGGIVDRNNGDQLYMNPCHASSHSSGAITCLSPSSLHCICLQSCSRKIMFQNFNALFALFGDNQWHGVPCPAASVENIVDGVKQGGEVLGGNYSGSCCKTKAARSYGKSELGGPAPS